MFRLGDMVHVTMAPRFLGVVLNQVPPGKHARLALFDKITGEHVPPGRVHTTWANNHLRLIDDAWPVSDEMLAMSVRIKLGGEA